MLTGSRENLRRGRLPSGRHGLPREFVTRSQRERLLAAVVRATAAKGYAATTVGDILVEAGVGRESFYEHFDDRLDCMLAAHRVLLDEIEAEIRAAYSAPGTWPERVVGALAVTLAGLASDLAAARFNVVEMSTVGPAFRTLFQDDFERFVSLLEQTVPSDGPVPPLGSAASLAIGATVAMIYREVTAERTADLPDLLPDLAYEFLLPFLGERRAREEQRRAAAR
jgi:AcrR family transcriptional regulator